MNWDWSLDGWIVLVGVLCAVSSALLGNFLVLRKLSMLGDAVSHAVLPGLAAAFLITQSRSSMPMFVGAAAVGVLTAMFTEWIRRFGRVDEGASMGVVFTTLFALGLVLIVQAADEVHLDPDCVLYGAIELTADDTISVGGWQVPRAACVLAVVTGINALFVLVFFKELKITSFDEALADSQGISSRWVHYGLMMLVALTAVASFESVGSILVVATLIVPPATAYLLTRRLGVMIVLSVIVAAAAAISGHLMAISLPRLFGFASTTTASMMAVATGLFFVVALLLSPQQGLIVLAVRRGLLSLRILVDDVVAYLYRMEEKGHPRVSRTQLREGLLAEGWVFRVALAKLRRGGLIVQHNETLSLLPPGRDHARGLIRSHRLWEQYLVSEADQPADRIHDKAEQWEHFTDRDLRQRLDESLSTPSVDPHGKSIPSEDQ
jgi:manganese/zinc/iron transport system permease protein